MASTLKINTLTGVTTAGSIAVTGEGNSTTTNLQQGLAKVFCNFDGTSTVSIRDSQNTASITDVGTGIYTVNFSNSMANDDYATGLTSRYSGSGAGICLSIPLDSLVTGNAVQTGNVSTHATPDYSVSRTDNDICCVTTHGDLA